MINGVGAYLDHWVPSASLAKSLTPLLELKPPLRGTALPLWASWAAERNPNEALSLIDRHFQSEPRFLDLLKRNVIRSRIRVQPYWVSQQLNLMPPSGAKDGIIIDLINEGDLSPEEKRSWAQEISDPIGRQLHSGGN
jgi:hypothetical protein